MITKPLTPRHWRPDGAGATIDTDHATSKAARTRERRRTTDTSVGVPSCTWTNRIGHPNNHSGGARNQCEMTASPAVDDRDKTARETVDTVCYWQTIPKPRAVLQEDLGKLKVHTVAGRAGRLRDDRPRVLLRLGIGGQGVPSRRPPRGLPRGARGQAWEAQPVVGRNVAPGTPHGRAAPGRRDTTRTPACKTEPMGRRRAVGRREVLRKPGEVARTFLQSDP
jgi:hypothetical protein